MSKPNSFPLGVQLARLLAQDFAGMSGLGLAVETAIGGPMFESPEHGPIACSACTLRGSETACPEIAKLQPETQDEATWSTCPLGVGLWKTTLVPGEMTVGAWGIAGPKLDVEKKLLKRLEHGILTLVREVIYLRTTVATTTHEIGLVLGAASDSAQELRQLSALPPDQWNEERMKEVRLLARTVGSEVEMGAYILENLVRAQTAATEPEAAIAATGKNFMWFDVVSLLSDVVDLISPLASHERLELQLEQTSGTGIPKLRGEPFHVKRALFNLLSNAIKYSYRTTEKGKQRFVRIYFKMPYSHSPRRLGIVVENFGLGLSEEELSLVTARGYRGKRARQERPMGSGIGLFEVQRIMRMHSGKVIVKSEPASESKDPDGPHKVSVTLVFPY